jgi:4-hydroxy-tetrahydrodipicolinate synthase
MEVCVLSSLKVHGVVVPLITPFKRDLGIDYDGLAWLLDRLVEAGVHGVFPSSSTGEFVHLSMDEVASLNRFVAERVGGRVRVLAGVTANSTHHVLRLAEDARDAGADAIVVAPPYYYRPSPEDPWRHFSTIAEKADIPLVLYDNPGITGIVIPIDVIVRLVEEYSSVAGVKVTYDSFTYLSKLISEAKAVRRDFSVLTGSAYLMLPALMAGGDGAVAALANIYPRTLLQLYSSWRSGDTRGVVEAYSRIIGMSRLYALPGHLGANIKALLSQAGAPVKPFSRPPAMHTGGEALKDFLAHHPIEL